MVLRDAFLGRQNIDEDLEEEIYSETPSESDAEERLQAPRTLPGFTAEGEEFGELQDYSNVTFTGPVKFKNVTFVRGCIFDGARFESTVTFIDVTVPSAAGNKTLFRKCAFVRDARFISSNLYLADFTGSEFNALGRFKGTKFLASSKFDDVKFGPATNFEKTVFNGAGNFSNASFRGQTNFDDCCFRYHQVSHARFESAVFDQIVTFDSAQFCGHVEFLKAHFNGGVTFANARFTASLDDSRKKQDNALDEGAESAGVATAGGDRKIDFREIAIYPSFEGELLSFENVQFGDHSAPRDMNFKKAQLGTTNCGSDLTADFINIKGIGSIDFQDVIVSQNVSVSFRDAKVRGQIDIDRTAFGTDSSFERLKCKELIVGNARFSCIPDFTQSTFTHAPKLNQMILPARPSRSSDRESSLYRLRALRNLARATNNIELDLKLLVTELKTKGGLASRMYGLISKHGQSWLRPALWLALFSLVVFPVAYLSLHELFPSSKTEIAMAVDVKSLSCADGEGGNAIAAVLEHSIKTAMIVSMDNEVRQQRIDQCLGGLERNSYTAAASTALEAVQIIFTAILLFFIGGAVRRRLQLR